MSAAKKSRSFNDKWLCTYPWLVQDQKTSGMKCNHCIAAKKSNPFASESGCLNFQNSTLIRHQESKDHSGAVKQLQLRNDFRKCVSSAICNDSKFKNYVTQLRTVYVMCKNNIAADNFTELMNLQQLNGCENVGQYYRSDEAVSEMESVLSDTVEKIVIDDIKASRFIGLMLDETCDISVDKKIVFYIRYIKNSVAQVSYVGNKKITDCTAEGIKVSVLDFLAEKGIEVTSLLGLGTDGASVMVGCRNGLGVKLKQHSEHLVQVHCVAHRLNLAASQAGKGIQYMVDYRDFIQRLYRFYADSSVRYDKLRELQVLLHGNVKQVPEGTSVRWLSVEAAVKMVFEYFDSIIMSLEDDKDSTGKAKGIWKFVGTTLFLLVTALLIDILTVIGILSLTFQKDQVNLSSIRHSVNSTIETLNTMKNGSITVNQVLQSLTDVDENDNHVDANRKTYKNIQLLDQSARFDGIRESYINNLTENLRNRFPEYDLDLLEAFDCVLNPKRFPENVRDLQDYAIQKLDILCQFYRSLPNFDEARCRAQFLPFKHLVYSYKTVLSFSGFTQLLLQEHTETYTDFVTLAQIALIIPVSSAPCERGFSHQKVLKNKVRNRLNPDRLSRLMMIKLVGPEVTDFDFLQVARTFSQMKDRKK